MQRRQDITLTPRGEKQVAVLFSAVMLLQFPVSSMYSVSTSEGNSMIDKSIFKGHKHTKHP